MNMWGRAIVSRGMSPLMIFFIVILILVLLLIFDQALILRNKKCIGDKIIDCAFEILLGEDDEQKPAGGAVTATGVLSGEFNGENHSVTIKMNIPLQGGAVTGSFDGDCEGSLTGTFAGGENGVISGNGGGSCGFVVPAKGNFSGNVNKATKTVTISGTGSAMGISKSGTMTLSY